MSDMNSNKMPVALDTTAFQAADSFIIKNPNPDPKRDVAFIQVVDVFCNGADLYFPLPQKQLGKPPRTLGLWTSPVPIIQLGLEKEGANILGKKLRHGFVQYVEGTAPHIAKWLAFQFTDDIVKQFLSRADLSYALQVSHIVANMIESNELPVLLDEIRSLQNEGKLSLHTSYYRSDFQSDNHLYVSYIFSSYIRGWQYAMGCAQHEDQPVYLCHWHRKNALIDKALASSKEHNPFSDRWFPWGTLLCKAYSLTQNLDFERISDNLNYIKNEGSEVIAALDAEGRTPIDIIQRHSSKLTDSQEVILKLLAKCKLYPCYNDTTRPERWIKIMQDIGKECGGIVNLGVQVVSSAMKSEWFRGIESSFRSDYRRGNYWNIFEDPGIEATLQKWRSGHI